MTEANIAQKKPFIVDLKMDEKKTWCACGHSASQPYCDGSHKTVEGGFVPVSFTSTKDGKVALCGCKHTKNPPYCDGTHKTL